MQNLLIRCVILSNIARSINIARLVYIGSLVCMGGSTHFLLAPLEMTSVPSPVALCPAIFYP